VNNQTTIVSAAPEPQRKGDQPPLDPVAKGILALLSVAFAAVVAAAYNYFTPAPGQQLIATIVSCAALAAVLGLWYLVKKHLPALRLRYREVLPLRRSSRLTVPNLITAARVPLAGLTFVALIAGRPATAFWFYMAGLATDVLDGMIARSIQGTTEWGKYFDAQVDAMFNGATGIALVVTAGITGAWWRAVVVVAVFVLFALRLVWAPSGPIPKYFSGFIRIVFFALLILGVPEATRTTALITGVVFLLFTAWYESRVMAFQHGDPQQR
jgi:CDP-diacylglycerol--glycerol-3-phosphate 3-phosphatidyltransferase